MNNETKRGPGRPPDPNTPKRKQVHLYLPEETYNAIRTLIGDTANMNTWLVEAAQERLQRDEMTSTSDTAFSHEKA